LEELTRGLAHPTSTRTEQCKPLRLQNSNVLTKQWHLDKALDVARWRMEYEKLLPKQR